MLKLCYLSVLNDNSYFPPTDMTIDVLTVKSGHFPMVHWVTVWTLQSNAMVALYCLALTYGRVYRMGGILFLPFFKIVEKNLCIQEVPSFTIKNSEGANILDPAGTRLEITLTSTRFQRQELKPGWFNVDSMWFQVVCPLGSFQLSIT